MITNQYRKKVIKMNTMMTENDKKQSGLRLQKLIHMTGLTISEFSSKYNIGTSTIHQWQQGRLNGISQKGAYKIVQAIRHEGIACHTSWLLDGSGQQPQYSDVRSYTQHTEFKPLSTHQKDLDKIYGECDTFLNQYQHAAVFKINNDSMEPYYKKGSFVGGIWEKPNSQKIIGKFCIIKLVSEKVIVRHVTTAQQQNKFHLSITNINSANSQTILQNTAIISAAPIVRCWIPQVVLDLNDLKS